MSESYDDSILEEDYDSFSEEEQEGFFKRNTSVFMISAALHLLVILVISFIPGDKLHKDEIVDFFGPDTKFIEIDEPDEIETIEKDIVIEQEKEVEVEDVTPEEDPDLESETLADDLPEDMPNETMDEPLPAENITVDVVEAMPPTLGLAKNMAASQSTRPGFGRGTGGLGGKGGKPGGGGTKTTTKSVNLALEWLAKHQEADGSWDATKYEGKRQERFGITACAILPFLAAGYSENLGPYKKTVRAGIRQLNKIITNKIKNQNSPFPHFGNNYGSAIGLMALSEASMAGSSSMTKKNADLIAKMFIDMHSKEPSGWHYNSGGDDLSVSGWVALGLKSARYAGIKSVNSKAADDVFKSYKTWVHETMTSYETGMGIYRPGKAPTRNMTWVGMFQKQYLGFSRKDPFLRKAAQLSVEKGWVNDVMKGDRVGDAYAIYYGTLAAFQQQGVFWKKWNDKMKVYLPRIQRKGDPKLLGGSWDPGTDHTSIQGGRVMTTALMALCVEVYIRYGILTDNV